MTTISAFSKYLAYSVGGAEKSTLELLRDRSSDGDSVTLISADKAKFIGHIVNPSSVPDSWSVLFLKDTHLLNRFSYLEYVLNRKRISHWFKNYVCDELWTYGIWAPAAMNSFEGRITYFVRSETDIGAAVNYHTGWRRSVKEIHRLLEYPALRVYRRDLYSGIRRCARIVANSIYMARRTREALNVEPEVWVPPVNVDRIRQYLSSHPDTGKSYIVFVGDNVYKGLNIVINIARLMPKLRFRIISRFLKHERIEGNILWSRWEDDSAEVYKGAALVIVPSQWEEAYGRVARESYLLGIPVLVSAVGGLPEAVEYTESCLVHDFRNPDAWINSIRKKLSD